MMAFGLMLLTPCVAQAVEFENLSHGAIVDGSLGFSAVGDAFLGELGGQASGIKSTHDATLLHQWHALVAFKAGELATTRPFTTLLGFHGRLMLESGYRFQADHAWSPYAGLHLGGELQYLVPPSGGLQSLKTINNIDGVGDLNLNGVVRLPFGYSWLDDTHALLLTAFVQVNGRIAEINLPNATFLDIGLAARFDVAHAWALLVDGLWGTTSSKANTALGLTDVTSHFQLEFDGRKVFANGMWFGTQVLYNSERNSLSNSVVTYNTRSAPTVNVMLLYGFPLGKQEWP
jgi:hypothetical protein